MSQQLRTLTALAEGLGLGLSSRQLVTPALGDLVSFSGLTGTKHTCGAHISIQTKTYTQKIRLKILKLKLIVKCKFQLHLLSK